jgi:hypothetical protein
LFNGEGFEVVDDGLFALYEHLFKEGVPEIEVGFTGECDADILAAQPVLEYFNNVLVSKCS